MRWIGWLMAALLVTGTGAGGDSKQVNAALKRVSKALKGLSGVVAEVEYSDFIADRAIDGTGKLYVSFAGVVRADIGGDVPRTLLFNPPQLYIYRKDDHVVDVYDVTSNPDRLGQYVMLGFVPSGSALKAQYDVRLAGDNTLDGKPVLSFLITPKFTQAARAVKRIQLWVDPESGLPVKHEVVHASGLSRLVVRYLSMSRDDELPGSLFQPRWPEGTTTVRK
jgi:outer membrane lipoprotein-sorting protein